MSEPSEPNLGINSWLEEELYQTYLHDRKYVDESWKSVFESNGHSTPAPSQVPARKETVNGAASGLAVPAVPLNPTDELMPMRGAAGKIAENMITSLTVPTATSQRSVQVRVLEENRQLINQLRALAGKSKVSYTHLIGWAILRALDKFPQLNDAFSEQDEQPFRVVRRQVNFGIAVDVRQKDGSSSLMVPNIKNARGLSFAEYMAAFDDVVARARSGKLQMSDFQGTTISLTNPGTVGTVGSVPRLMVGQGAIIATGAMDYPAEYQSVSADTRAALGLSKIMTVTCTYDHRIIQGAESGRFLGRVHELLNGADEFYEQIFHQFGFSLKPFRLETPTAPSFVTGPAAAPTAMATDPLKEAGVAHLINSYRVRGHLIANIDPLGSTRLMHPDLDPATHGLTIWDLDRRVVSEGNRTLRDVLEDLRETYSASIGPEYMYIPHPEQKNWLRDRMESTKNQWPLSKETRLRILQKLLEAEQFEQFLHTRFIGKKRFSLEGGDAAIALLDEIVERAAENSVQELFIGMAHRGRLNVLANVVGKPIHQVLSEFEEAPDSAANAYGTGDVKYHLGASAHHTTSAGLGITVSVAFNPSHLEAVDPVVEGMVRARQDRLGDNERDAVVPVLIHGDAAFAGQGVVPETLNLSRLEGYSTGGTIHVVINNQIGFTTPPDEARSGHYATDIARAVQSPIWHVNADDPEAVVRVAQMAFDFRQDFNKDVVIDLVCYRRHGHNEGDDPTYTQPLMYRKIRNHPTVFTQYSQRLVREGLVTQQEVDELRKHYVAKLSEAHEITKRNIEAYELLEEHGMPLDIPQTHTAIDRDTAELVMDVLTRVPEDFHLHPKLKSFMDRRREALSGGTVDWALGEALAFGSLVAGGIPVRLTGQDVARGTFSQRHLELYDVENGNKYVPLKNVIPGQAHFEVWDSSLSEYAAMGFEFGFTLADPATLVIWEAQFGDFVNGAQIIIDQFLSSAETKWGQPSGLVLLLPHGYEGQGPEHSSARIERFLQLSAENNMQVGNCTTPAQYFHVLRRHMMSGPGGKPLLKPLVLFTPKSMLRNPKAVSRLEDFTTGDFLEVIDDASVDPNTVTRILLCSGKVYYDLLAGREERNARHVAIVRVEQMYPFPQAEIERILNRYSPSAEVFWVQEEPRNMGPWRFMHDSFPPVLDHTRRRLYYAGRPEYASPAAGTTKRHEQEQAELVSDAFAERHVVRRPKRVRVVAKRKKQVEPG
jgi:2-oxoglutarate dehydrogenase E1 component